MSGKWERQRSTSPKWKPKPWLVAKAVVEKKPRIRSASLGPREKKNYEWTVRRMTTRIPMWWPFYSTLCRHIYRRDLIGNTFPCKSRAQIYYWQSTAAIILWASMHLFIFYSFHQLIIFQLQYTAHSIDSVSLDFEGESLEPWWPYRVHIIEAAIGWASGVVGALMAGACYLPLPQPGGDYEAHVSPECCVDQMQLYEKYESNGADLEDAIPWWVPYLGGWFRREQDRMKTYECLEQRRIYRELLSLWAYGGLCCIILVSYWTSRWSSLWPTERFRQFPDIIARYVFDGLFAIMTVATVFCLTGMTPRPWRRPENKHSRPGECCRRRVTRDTVAAWRYQMLQTTTVHHIPINP